MNATDEPLDSQLEDQVSEQAFETAEPIAQTGDVFEDSISLTSDDLPPSSEQADAPETAEPIAQVEDVPADSISLTSSDLPPSSEQADAPETPKAVTEAQDVSDESTLESLTSDSRIAPSDTDEVGDAIEATEESVTVEQAVSGDETQVDTISDVDRAPVTQDETGDESKVTEQVGRVNADNVQAETSKIFAHANVGEGQKASDTEKVAEVKLNPDIRRKVEAVFVPSQDYENMRERGFGTHEERVFIVYGEEHAGKFACAVHLGLDLLGPGQSSQPKFRIYKRTTRDTRSLIDFAQRSDLAKGTIYIVENAFENGIELADLSSSHLLSAINEALEKKNNYLILTTVYQAEQLNKLQVGQVSAVVEDIHAVFEKHLTRYGDFVERVHVPAKLIELAREAHEKLEAYFQWPFQVDLFCNRLSRLTSEAKEEDLSELAEQVGRIGQEPARPWFEGLSDNEKLYAMLVVLFNGIDRILLDEIYTTAVQRLRESGVSSLCDPRETGLDDVLERIQAHETGARSVRFNSLAFEREARRQIFNHHHLLWSFIDLLLALIEEFKAPYYWELRKDLGAAIGRLGVYRKNKLNFVLEALAKHEHGGVVAVAGSALDEICRTGPEHYVFVTELLDRWVSSGDPDLMWATGASIWRIYDGLARATRGNGEKNQEASQAVETLSRVQDSLTNLAEAFDRFNKKARARALEDAFLLAGLEYTVSERAVDIEPNVVRHMQDQLGMLAANNVRSILHAVRQIAPLHPEDMVEQITSWLEAAEDSNLRRLGQRAGRQLFDENSDPEIQLLKERHEPLLNLVGPLLSTDEETVDAATRALLVWLQRSDDWAHRVHSALLRVVNRSKKKEINILRASLSRQWLDSDSMDARRIGQSLIARSYVMEGVPTDMPGRRYGVIALDASRKARMNQVCARAGRKLYERLDPQVDVFVVRMGETQTLAKSGQPVSTTDLQAENDRPRLLVPALEDLAPSSRTCFVLALAWGSIVDLDDICAESWSDCLLVAKVKRDAKPSETLTVIPVDRLMSDLSLKAVEDAVRERLGRTLATREAEEWRSALSEHIEVTPSDIDAVVVRLNDWVEKLDDIEHSKYPGDIARTITCTILWLATVNLPRCIKVVRTWLTDGNELSRLMGVVCGKTLFRVYAQCDPVPSVQSHAALLELAPLLAEQGWDGAEAVLYAARHWGEQPEWLERLFTRSDGNLGELVQLVDAVLPESHDVLADTLKGWLAAENDKAAPGSIVKMAERLQLRMALGTRTPLPDLPEDHTYGLIIVDASSHNRRARNRLAKLASNVIKGLNERNQETLHLLVYRMGQDYPVAGPGEKPSADALIPSGSSPRPRLMGPLLEVHSVQQVSFVLLLTNGSVIDAEDWHDTHWIERIRVYSDVDRSVWFRTDSLIPRQSELEEAEQVIIRNLEQRRGA